MWRSFSSAFSSSDKGSRDPKRLTTVPEEKEREEKEEEKDEDEGQSVAAASSFAAGSSAAQSTVAAAAVAAGQPRARVLHMAANARHRGLPPRPPSLAPVAPRAPAAAAAVKEEEEEKEAGEAGQMALVRSPLACRLRAWVLQPLGITLPGSLWRLLDLTPPDQFDRVLLAHMGTRPGRYKLANALFWLQNGLCADEAEWWTLAVMLRHSKAMCDLFVDATTNLHSADLRVRRDAVQRRLHRLQAIQAVFAQQAAFPAGQRPLDPFAHTAPAPAPSFVVPVTEELDPCAPLPRPDRAVLEAMVREAVGGTLAPSVFAASCALLPVPPERFFGRGHGLVVLARFLAAKVQKPSLRAALSDWLQRFLQVGCRCTH